MSMTNNRVEVKMRRTERQKRGVARNHPGPAVKLTPAFFDGIRELIVGARATAARGVDLVQVHTNFEIGRRIVREEQLGKDRAAYGQEVIKALAERLTDEFGTGFSLSNLKSMRQFYLQNQQRIGQTASGLFNAPSKNQSLTGQFVASSKSQTVSGQFGITQAPSKKSPVINKIQARAGKSGPPPLRPFTLSWSHYVFLLGIKNTGERSFYEIESSEQNWTVRELKRQFDSGLYERLALSRDKDGIRRLAQEGQIVSQARDLLKEPLVLEFLGLDERTRYSESDLESAIIGQVERFLLEMGKGFLFEARQKRFTFDEEHFFVDLVFYNRLLRCYVLLDLKIGRIAHQDLGQMQMYVNYFDRCVKTAAENSTIGIVLCKQKNKALVEITLPKDANIHAREYQLYLPSKDELQQKLLEWVGE
jgi:predicted nuclease of restriction endonuclease-like (RecB) superfamily